jgi:hypothetical protein
MLALQQMVPPLRTRRRMPRRLRKQLQRRQKQIKPLLRTVLRMVLRTVLKMVETPPETTTQQDQSLKGFCHPSASTSGMLRSDPQRTSKVLQLRMVKPRPLGPQQLQQKLAVLRPLEQKQHRIRQAQ